MVLLLSQRTDEDKSSSIMFAWGPQRQLPSLDTDTPFNLTGEFLQFSVDIITKIVADKVSLTLLITTREAVDGHACFLFHPFDAEDEDTAEFLVKLNSAVRCPESRRSDSELTGANRVDKTLLGVLETFGRLSRFYYGTARYLVTGEDLTTRPRGTALADVIVNPWIQSRALELPCSRRREPSSIPEGCQDELFKLMMFTSGSIEDERSRNWKRLFSIREETPFSFLTDGAQIPIDTKIRIEKDVFRTDRSEVFYYPTTTDIDGDLQRPHLSSLYRILAKYAIEHPEVDYVQGMNDIASPILFIMQNEPLAYGIFENVMQRQRLYFIANGGHTECQLARLSAMLQIADPLLHDRLGFAMDNAALFVSYRWLLLLFKREVGFRAYPRVLEVILAAPTANYELLIALALLIIYRDDLLKFGHRFDLTLQFYSEKANHHDIDKLLNLADQFHQYFISSSPILADPRLKGCFVPPI